MEQKYLLLSTRKFLRFAKYLMAILCHMKNKIQSNKDNAQKKDRKREVAIKSRKLVQKVLVDSDTILGLFL